MKALVCLPYFLAELQKVGVPGILVAVEDPFCFLGTNEISSEDSMQI
jgi:hypothetical protein